MRGSVFETSRERLAKHALTLKKAWLLSCAWLGKRLDSESLTIYDYQRWPKRRLVQHVKDLEDDFADQVRWTLRQPDKKIWKQLASWMSTQFDRWQEAGGSLLTICTAHEFESQFGELRVQEHIEVPPYAELLIQGWYGLAIRHPEYMLARDLAFLYSLFQESEKLLQQANWQNPQDWTKRGSENAQALARAVIQTCFNLLESFVSGLARGHVMTNGHLDEGVRTKLLDNSKPLRNRVLSIPLLISGKDCGLNQHRPPLSTLFGGVKQRRDAFVHCEPGPQSSSHGYVKEAAFHDVSPAVVEAAVQSTEQLIRQIWQGVFEQDGPCWLLHLAEPEAARTGFRLRPVVEEPTTEGGSASNKRSQPTASA